MRTFNSDQWKAIIARQEMYVGDRLNQYLACISDQDAEQFEKLFSKQNVTLTRKGSYLIAHRVNDMLDADNFIATFLVKGVGNLELFRRIGDLICRDDAPIFRNLPNVPRVNDAFASARQYIANRQAESHDCPP